MYTTLALLSTVQACSGGLGRQLSFWGTQKEAKDQSIPLHAVALIGGVDDAQWAINAGLIISPVEFRELYERTALWMWRHLMNDRSVSDVVRQLEDEDYFPRNKTRVKSAKALTKEEQHPARQFYVRACHVQTVRELETLRTELSYFGVQDGLMTAANDLMWHVPSVYLRRLSELSSGTKSVGYWDGKEWTSQVLFKEWKPLKASRPGEAFARLLKPEGTYDFLHEMPINRKRADVTIVLNEDKSVSVQTADPKLAFETVRTLLNRGGVRNFDPDSNDDEEDYDELVETFEANIAEPVPVRVSNARMSPAQRRAAQRANRTTTNAPTVLSNDASGSDRSDDS